MAPGWASLVEMGTLLSPGQPPLDDGHVKCAIFLPFKVRYTVPNADPSTNRNVADSMHQPLDFLSLFPLPTKTLSDGEPDTLAQLSCGGGVPVGVGVGVGLLVGVAV